MVRVSKTSTTRTTQNNQCSKLSVLDHLKKNSPKRTKLKKIETLKIHLSPVYTQ